MSQHPTNAICGALTADLGCDRRAKADEPPANVLDFDGFLHVKDVDRFIRALREWQEFVNRPTGFLKTRRITRDALLAKVAP